MAAARVHSVASEINLRLIIASAEYGGGSGKASEVNCHWRTLSVISAIGETTLFDLMTPTEEFNELRDWFARKKREPAFWVAVLLPWLFAIFTVEVPTILMTAFPFSDAKKTLQILQTSDVGVWHYRVGCKLPQGTYVFGYDLSMKPYNDEVPFHFGRVCRDVVQGGWIFAKIPGDLGH